MIRWIGVVEITSSQNAENVNYDILFSKNVLLLKWFVLSYYYYNTNFTLINSLKISQTNYAAGYN